MAIIRHGAMRYISATAAEIIGRLSNILLTLLVVSLYGASRETDLFFLLFTIAFFIYGTLSNALVDILVPIIHQKKKVIQPSIWLAIAFLLSFFLFCIALWYDASIFLATGVALMALSGLSSSISVGLLRSEDKYSVAGMLWSFRLVPLVLFYIYNPAEKSLPWLALGVGLADLARAILLGYISRSYWQKWLASTGSSAGKGPVYSKIVMLLLPSVIVGLNPLVDRWVASFSGEGGVTVIEFADRIYGVIASASTIGLMSVLLNSLSRHFVQGTLAWLWPRVLVSVFAWSVLGVLFGFVIGEYLLTDYLLKYASISKAHVSDAMQAFWYYLPGLPAFVVGMVCVRRIIVQAHSNLLIMLSVLALIFNIVFSILFNRFIGVAGIALATTLANTIITIVMLSYMNTGRLQRTLS